MKLYHIVKCSNCGLAQVTSSTNSLKCQRCSKSRVMSSLKKFFSSYDAKEASIALQKLKENEAIQKDKFSLEFGEFKLNK